MGSQLQQSAGTVKGHKILVIDDDRDVLDLLEQVFKSRSAEVMTAASGPEGLRLLYRQQPDLVILDIMMPVMDGWQVLRQIRQLTDVPVIILSVLNADRYIVRSFEMGAHDFVSKPFSILVLLARAERLLRQTTVSRLRPSLDGVYDDGRLRIDLTSQEVSLAGSPVRLTHTERALLAFLVRHAGQVLSIDQILAGVWGWDLADHPEYVHTYVSRLRHKLEKDPAHPKYILTEHGVGYRFSGNSN